MGHRPNSLVVVQAVPGSSTVAHLSPCKSPFLDCVRDHELLLRLQICDLVGEPPTRVSAATIREDIADLMARLDETERRTEAFPQRRRYQLLVLGFYDACSSSSTRSNETSRQSRAAYRRSATRTVRHRR